MHTRREKSVAERLVDALPAFTRWRFTGMTDGATVSGWRIRDHSGAPARMVALTAWPRLFAIHGEDRPVFWRELARWADLNITGDDIVEAKRILHWRATNNEGN